MTQMPSIQQRIAELRIQDLHAEAAHARLVKEARAARRVQRGPSRLARLVAGFRTEADRLAAQPAPAEAQTIRTAARRTAAKTVVPC